MKYTILYCVFVRTFVIPFYYGFGTIINYGSGSNFLTSYGSELPVPFPHDKKLRFLWFRFRFRFHNTGKDTVGSARARCIPAAVCVVRLDVARIDESPG
jgi:hypothetical protein